MSISLGVWNWTYYEANKPHPIDQSELDCNDTELAFFHARDFFKQKFKSNFKIYEPDFAYRVENKGDCKHRVIAGFEVEEASKFKTEMVYIATVQNLKGTPYWILINIEFFKQSISY